MNPYEIEYDELTKRFTLYQNPYIENKLTISDNSFKLTHRQLINLIANLFTESANQKISFHKIIYIFRLLGHKLKSEGLLPTLNNTINLLENSYKSETGVIEITPDMGKFFKVDCKLNQLNLYETFKNLHDNIKEQIPNCPKQKMNPPKTSLLSNRRNTLFKNEPDEIKPIISKRENGVKELAQIISEQLSSSKSVTIESANTNNEKAPLVTVTEKEEQTSKPSRCCCLIN